ncbi:uncharacterized protein BDR25DRAFT_367780 [Lindgomyces ingoldianus]|uniref:Uncharacterized protein n=1 Tax=Lindgomyces ingoldianus TaxID=673940 RepID=A0ACB6QYE6_9PLEO|nr:uncharacterized protein BDR25DRAFT_367780 [Lindgomyces ingoldianus]KAF2471885.1 hypothetical protein BDR25DRAFT_367780 [Lindgomyces ingoldianus]
MRTVPFNLPFKNSSLTLGLTLNRGCVLRRLMDIDQDIQVNSAMILVLPLPLALSFDVSNYIEGSVITTVVIDNAIVSFVQEFQAEKKVGSLRALSSPTATVLRNGGVRVIPSVEIVPGDVVIVKRDDKVPI